MKTLKYIVLCMITIIAVSCTERSDPPHYGRWGYLGPSEQLLLPSEGGETVIDLDSPIDESVIPIDLLASSAAIPFLPKENWIMYVESGMALLPEQIYKDAGYMEYPNLLDFSYSFHWATFSTYKKTETKNGYMRIVYEKNPDENPRRLYVHFNGFYNETIEVIQLGQSGYI